MAILKDKNNRQEYLQERKQLLGRMRSSGWHRPADAYPVIEYGYDGQYEEQLSEMSMALAIEQANDEANL